MSTICKPVIHYVKGFRGDSDNSRVVFQTENIDVDMRLMPNDGIWTIIGQVLSGDGHLLPPLMVHLLRDGYLVQESRTNYIGEFSFSDVESAIFVLEIDLPDGRLVGRFEVG